MIDLRLGDCVSVLKEIDDNSIDLTVTSPPYDNLRSYKGNNELWSEQVWKEAIAELYRVTKDGGVVVWVVGDATIKGGETLTSFKQALHAVDCGFNQHDTMIYAKNNYIPLTHNRYEQAFEYMFVWSKGKPGVFNPIMVDCKTKGTARSRKKSNKEQGASVRNRDEVTVTKDKKQKSNIWFNNVSNTGYKHPAIFPEQLAYDHIISWSNYGDVVLDPFMGSGTTGAMAVKLGRRFIGIELEREYYDISYKRIKEGRK